MLDTPGVYIQEIPSGSAPIAGVATSNTAFVGVLARGPVGRAVRVTSWGEFERVFGGLHASCETSYAVRNYFLNGGGVAFIVRAENGAEAASLVLPPADGGLALLASSPGSWGNDLCAGIARAADATDRFDLLLRLYRGEDVVREEAYAGLSTDVDHPRHILRVLAAESQLAVVDEDEEIALPAATVSAGAAVESLDGLRRLAAAGLASFAGGGDGVFPADNDAWQEEAVDAIGNGIDALDSIVPDVFNLMCLPDVSLLGQSRLDVAAQIYNVANRYCERNFAFLIVDPPAGSNRDNIVGWTAELGATVRRNAALYYPKLTAPDPLNPLASRDFAPSGAVAGIFARTDGARGVWKAPAGTAAGVAGGRPADIMTDPQQGPLNVQGINVIRTFPVYNTIVWGARTLDGADALASEWKYIPVRRLALHIEHSLLRGLQWVVFEPNDEPLWASVRLNVTAFMSQLHRQGAFQGASARDAFLVKCDSETTTQADINLGILNILVGFAPVRPAEFVLLRIQQRMQSSN